MHFFFDVLFAGLTDALRAVLSDVLQMVFGMGG